MGWMLAQQEDHLMKIFHGYSWFKFVINITTDDVINSKRGKNLFINAKIFALCFLLWLPYLRHRLLGPTLRLRKCFNI
jgi:hypothetical protein